MSSATVFVEKMSVQVKKRSGQGRNFENNPKFQILFLAKTGRKSLWQILSQQTAQLDGVPLISTKTLALSSLL